MTDEQQWRNDIEMEIRQIRTDIASIQTNRSLDKVHFLLEDASDRKEIIENKLRDDVRDFHQKSDQYLQQAHEISTSLKNSIQEKGDETSSGEKGRRE